MTQLCNYTILDPLIHSISVDFSARDNTTMRPKNWRLVNDHSPYTTVYHLEANVHFERGIFRRRDVNMGFDLFISIGSLTADKQPTIDLIKAILIDADHSDIIKDINEVLRGEHIIDGIPHTYPPDDLYSLHAAVHERLVNALFNKLPRHPLARRPCELYPVQVRGAIPPEVMCRMIDVHGLSSECELELNPLTWRAIAREPKWKGVTYNPITKAVFFDIRLYSQHDMKYYTLRTEVLVEKTQRDAIHYGEKLLAVWLFMLMSALVKEDTNPIVWGGHISQGFLERAIGLSKVAKEDHLLNDYTVEFILV